MSSQLCPAPQGEAVVRVDAVGVTEDPPGAVLVAAEDPRVPVLVTPLAAEVVVAWVVVLVPPVA